jgi:hypothetical protein
MRHVKIKPILEYIKASAEIDIPVAIYNYDENLSDFDKYHIGASRDAKQLGFFVYSNDGDFTYSRSNVSVMIYLQLYQTEELDVAAYIDVVSEWVSRLDLSDYGLDMLENLNYESYYVQTERSAHVFIVASWSREQDDCDIR